VYQPGVTIAGADILSAVKDALIAQGMPTNYGVATATTLSPVTVATDAAKGIKVREAFYDAGTESFSALVQIPPNDPQAIFIPLRGAAFPTIQVPVLNAAAGKTTT